MVENGEFAFSEQAAGAQGFIVDCDGSFVMRGQNQAKCRRRRVAAKGVSCWIESPLYGDVW